MRWTQQDDELLVENVKKYEWLYNRQHMSYKDIKMKENSWREIAENIKPGEPENSKVYTSVGSETHSR